MSVHQLSTLPQAVRGAFASAYGGPAPRLFFAPGRVNLIGAHLDYNGGDVLPLAVDRGLYVAARLRGDGLVRLRSLDQSAVVELDTTTLTARADRSHGWASYPLGVWGQFAVMTGRRAGVDLLFGSDLPMASGLSSSAAIEVATATALDALHGTALDRLTVAMLAHRAETDYVGVKCGIMDQFASALGRAGHALLLHCHARTHELVPLDPDGFEVLVMDTRKPRTLATSGFNQRVRECGDAHAALRAAGIDRSCLAAYSPTDLAHAPALPGVLAKRARHVVTEMVRVAAAVRALRRGDFVTFGRCLDESHLSTAHDLEVSCPELDVITGAARACADVFGARLVGAGFGGCAIALIKPGSAAAVEAAVADRFVAEFDVRPRFEVLHAGPGPRELA